MRSIPVICLMLVVIAGGAAWLARDPEDAVHADRPTPSTSDPALHKAERVLRLGHDMPPTSSVHAAVERFAERVQRETGGRICVEIFPDQQLGTDQQMIEMGRTGELDLLIPPAAKLSPRMPELELLSFPFLFRDRDHCYRALDDGLSDELMAPLEQIGLVGLAMYESGFIQMTANRPLREVADLEGVRFRVMKSRFLRDLYSEWGAEPRNIDFHMVRKALADGVVDAQENPVQSIYAMEIYREQKYLMRTDHAYLGMLFSASRKTFDQFSAVDQKIVAEAARASAKWLRHENRRVDQEWVEEIAKTGTEVITLTAEAREQLRRTALPAVRRSWARIIDREIDLDHAVSVLDPEIDLVVGLDADLKLGARVGGRAILQGMRLAASEINRAGGVLGRPIRVVARDHSGIAARGLTNFQYFDSVPNLVAVFSGIHSPVALAEIDFVHESGIPFLIPWAAATNIVENGRDPNYVFRVSVRDEWAGPFLVDRAMGKGKRIGLLLEETGWGRSNQASMTKALASAGLSPVHTEWFPWGKKDFGGAIRRMVDAGAEVVLLVANHAEGTEIVQEFAKLTDPPAIVSHWGIASGAFFEENRSALELLDLTFLQTFDATVAPTDFRRAYEVRYPGAPELSQAPVGVGHAYDLMHLLAIAIEDAESLDRAEIRHAIEQLEEYDGVVQKYDRPFLGDHEGLTPTTYRLCRFGPLGQISPVLEK